MKPKARCYTTSFGTRYRWNIETKKFIAVGHELYKTERGAKKAGEKLARELGLEIVE